MQSRSGFPALHLPTGSKNGFRRQFACQRCGVAAPNPIGNIAVPLRVDPSLQRADILQQRGLALLACCKSIGLSVNRALDDFQIVAVRRRYRRIVGNSAGRNDRNGNAFRKALNGAANRGAECMTSNGSRQGWPGSIENDWHNRQIREIHKLNRLNNAVIDLDVVGTCGIESLSQCCFENVPGQGRRCDKRSNRRVPVAPACNAAHTDDKRRHQVVEEGAEMIGTEDDYHIRPGFRVYGGPFR